MCCTSFTFFIVFLFCLFFETIAVFSVFESCCFCWELVSRLLSSSGTCSIRTVLCKELAAGSVVGSNFPCFSLSI